jgi:hypothetical protein
VTYIVKPDPRNLGQDDEAIEPFACLVWMERFTALFRMDVAAVNPCRPPCHALLELGSPPISQNGDRARIKPGHVSNFGHEHRPQDLADSGDLADRLIAGMTGQPPMDVPIEPVYLAVQSCDQAAERFDPEA